MRRDPSALEEALESLRAAGKAWDTFQVRQEIEDCTVALQRRRDRVGIADFEVRGDVGLAAAGRAIAEALLPALKPRFDVVERSQLDRVLREINLEAGELSGNAPGQVEVGRLAKVRYLILGSVMPFNGVTVNARLVEVNSGLVVQTATLASPNLETVMPRLPQLAQMLMMSDEQKLAFQQALAQQAAGDNTRPAGHAVASSSSRHRPAPASDCHLFRTSPRIWRLAHRRFSTVSGGRLRAGAGC